MKNEVQLFIVFSHILDLPLDSPEPLTWKGRNPVTSPCSGLPSCSSGWWWHVQLVMFSQLALRTSKWAFGHRGVCFTVKRKNPPLGKVKTVCVCAKVCEVMGALRWSSVTLLCTSSACPCVFTLYVCVKWWMLCGDHLCLSSTRPLPLCVCVCVNMHMCEWRVL